MVYTCYLVCAQCVCTFLLSSSAKLPLLTENFFFHFIFILLHFTSLLTLFFPFFFFCRWVQSCLVSYNTAYTSGGASHVLSTSCFGNNSFQQQDVSSAVTSQERHLGTIKRLGYTLPLVIFQLFALPAQRRVVSWTLAVIAVTAASASSFLSRLSRFEANLFCFVFYLIFILWKSLQAPRRLW